MYSAGMVDDLRRGAERMGERASAAREAAVEKAEAAKEAIALVKPKLRGVSHEWAFFLSIGFGVALIVLAKSPKATAAVAVYEIGRAHV